MKQAAGACLDVTSQLNYLTNKFSHSYGGQSKQKAWQFCFSAEVVLSIQGHIRNNTYVYADVRYQQSFKGSKEGVQFNVGIKANF